MKKKNKQYAIIVSLLIFLGFLVFAAIPKEVRTVFLKAMDSRDTKTIISNYMGISVNSCQVLQESDSHGGFLGDGQTFVELQASPEEFRYIVEKMTTKWKSLPLTKNLSKAVYGETAKEGRYMPLLTDRESGAALIPSIEKGYYYFQDRNNLNGDLEDDSRLFDRYSYNFTLVICDKDRNRIYYIKYDT